MVFILKGRVLLVLLTGGYVTVLGLWRDRASSVVPETEAIRAGEAVEIRAGDYRGAVAKPSAGEVNRASPAGEKLALGSPDRIIRVRERRNGVALSPLAAARLRVLLAGRE